MESTVSFWYSPILQDLNIDICLLWSFSLQGGHKETCPKQPLSQTLGYNWPHWVMHSGNGLWNFYWTDLESCTSLPLSKCVRRNSQLEKRQTLLHVAPAPTQKDLQMVPSNRLRIYSEISEFSAPVDVSKGGSSLTCPLVWIWWLWSFPDHLTLPLM